MSQNQNDIFDYAMPLLKIEKLERDIHDACNTRNYRDVGEMVNELIVNARMVRAWANHHLDVAAQGTGHTLHDSLKLDEQSRRNRCKDFGRRKTRNREQSVQTTKS